ncbi:MAG: hypothetical protein WBA16_01260 [Nonlabens sp.]
MKIRLISLLIASLYFYTTNAQESTTVKVTHFPGNTLVDGKSKFVLPKYKVLSTTGQNCFNFLQVTVSVRASNYEPAPYAFKVTIKNLSNYPIAVDCSLWGFGTGGRSTIPARGSYGNSGKNLDEKYPTITIRNVKAEFNESTKNQYGVSASSRNLKCGESIQSYLDQELEKMRLEQKIRNLKDQIRSLGTDEAALNQKLAFYRELKELDQSKDYSRQISEIDDNLKRISDKRIENQNNISNLKNQIDKLGTDKPALEKKKELYKELQRVDVETDYSNEIDEIESSLKKIDKESTEARNNATGSDNASTEEQKDKENDKEKSEEELKEESAERKRIEDRAAQKAAREQEAARRREVQRKKDAYQDRIDNQQNQNDAVAASSAASSAAILYLLGGIIYDNAGKPARDLFSGNNFHASFDFGYGVSAFPLSFASVKSSTNNDGDEIFTPEATDATALTIDLRLLAKFGYEHEYGGGNLYGRFEPGFSPILSGFNTSYGYGAEVFGGHKNAKLYARYELGSNNFSENGWLDATESGDGGSSSTSYQQFRAGLKFSYYRNSRTAKRDHITLGVMENYFDEDSAVIFSNRIEPDEGIINIQGTEPNFTAVGYFFEWKRDHTHRLYLEFFTNYPVTGEMGGTNSEGQLFLQAGFIRSIEGFFQKK